MLVDRGLVIRTQDTCDRRHIRLDLTPAGDTLMDAIFDDTRQRMRELYASLTDDELHTLIEAMDSLKKVLPEWTRFFKLFRLIKPYWKKSVLSLVLLTALVIMDFAIPRLRQRVIDQGISIRNADELLVIRDGEIVEKGTHQQLLDQHGFYHNLYLSQFKGEEIWTKNKGKTLNYRQMGLRMV
ncbi:MAG: hypothetical protein WCF08_10485 [Anaerolineaceae bacterium]